MTLAGPLTARRTLLALLAAALLLALAALAAALMGSTPIDIGKALSDPGSIDHTVLFDHRLPRVLQGLVTGAILAGSGAVLQGLLRNPLADPFILGVSGGAALGATAVGLLGLASTLADAAGGFIGAIAATLLVAALATRGGRLRPLDMLLIGVVFNAIAGALMMLLQAMASPDAVHRVLLRMMGSLSVDPARPLLLPVLAFALAIFTLAVLGRARALNLLALGDDTARSLGVAPEALRPQLFVVLSLAIGAVVAVTGMIGFVGLIVPHAVRLALGPDHRLLLPVSALGGAAFVVVADGLVRVLAVPLGSELPVGAVTAVVGGPLFLVLLQRRGAQDRLVSAPAAPAPAPALALAARALGHRYGAREALAGVDLTLAPGQVTALLGPNGSGKTTLLRALAGLLAPSAGEVRLGDRPLSALRPAERARAIAVVPAHHAPPDFAWSALEVTLMGRAPWIAAGRFESARDLEAAHAALARVDAAALAGRAFLTLSAGEQQRVLTARALCQGTPVLLLDEPTSHLDPAHRLRFAALFTALAAEGRTVGVVVHDLDLATRADRVALLDGGRLVASGPPEAVLTPATLRAVYGVAARVVDAPPRRAVVLDGVVDRPPES